MNTAIQAPKRSEKNRSSGHESALISQNRTKSPYQNEKWARHFLADSWQGATQNRVAAAICIGAMLLVSAHARCQSLYVSDDSSHIYTITPGGTQSTFASGLNLSFGLAFNSAGDLFEANQYTGNVYEFTPGGVRSTFASGLAQPEGMAFDSSGNLYVSQLGTGPVNTGGITKITPGGVQSTFASGFDADGPGLAFNSAGILFAPIGSTIQEFTTGGVASTFASGLLYAHGLAFNSSGDLFVTAEATGNNGVETGVIYEYTPGGVRTTFAAGFGAPMGLAFNNAGDLFVADAGSGHIYEYTPGGVQSIFATFASGTEPHGLAFSVPEPSVFALLSVSAAAFLIRRRFR